MMPPLSSFCNCLLRFVHLAPYYRSSTVRFKNKISADDRPMHDQAQIGLSFRHHGCYSSTTDVGISTNIIFCTEFLHPLQAL